MALGIAAVVARNKEVKTGSMTRFDNFLLPSANKSVATANASVQTWAERSKIASELA